MEVGTWARLADGRDVFLHLPPHHRVKRAGAPPAFSQNPTAAGKTSPKSPKYVIAVGTAPLGCIDFSATTSRLPADHFPASQGRLHPAADLAAAPVHPCRDASGPHFPKSLVVLGAFISLCSQERPEVQTRLSASSLEIWQLCQPAEPFLMGSNSISGALSKSYFAKHCAVLDQELRRSREGQEDSRIVVPRVTVSHGRCSARYGGLP